MYKFSKNSLTKLEGVHTDLVKLINIALQESELDFCVTSGVRTKIEQDNLIKSGKSNAKNSRHLTGHAIDIAIMINKKIEWNNYSLYENFSILMKSIATRENIKIKWGGDFRNSKGKLIMDGVHFELDENYYK